MRRHRVMTRGALMLSLLLVAGCGRGDVMAQDRQSAERDIRDQLGAVPAVVDTATAQSLSRTFRGAAARALPSVVTIQVTARPRTAQNRNPLPFPFPFGQQEQGEMPPQVGTGSGFVLTGDGYVITNNHVIENATTVQVRFVDGRVYDNATVVGRDPNTDVAVLKIDPRGNEQFQPLPLGDSDALHVGDWVIALGNPLSLGFTVTAGIVSAKGRSLGIVGGETALESFIQTDAAINRGNSGGPLVDLLGRVVGVNTAISSPTGFYAGNGFAIPIAIAAKVATDIIEHGAVRRPRIGVRVTAVTEAQAELYGLDRIAGALVNEVEPGEPAARAGIRAEDVIVSLDGEPIDNSVDLTTRLARRSPGERVTLGIVREGRRIEVPVRLGQFEAAEPRPNRTAAAESPEQTLGLSVAEVTPQLARQYDINEDVRGVVVTSVNPYGPAAQQLGPGDVIIEFNRQPVRTPAELRRLAQQVERGDIVVIRVRSAQTGNIGVRSFRVR